MRDILPLLLLGVIWSVNIFTALSLHLRTDDNKIERFARDIIDRCRHVYPEYSARG